MIDQGSPIKVSRIYIQNRTDTEFDKFQDLYICIGNDPSSPSNNPCTTVPIHEGGFIILELPAGRYVFLYRIGHTADTLNLSVARAFQAPNLLEDQFGAEIIADCTPEVGYEKENLTSNLAIRTTRYDVEPVIDTNGTTTTAFSSCFRI